MAPRLCVATLQTPPSLGATVRQAESERARTTLALEATHSPERPARRQRTSAH
jgi:hypothetical protein